MNRWPTNGSAACRPYVRRLPKASHVKKEIGFQFARARIICRNDGGFLDCAPWEGECNTLPDPRIPTLPGAPHPPRRADDSNRVNACCFSIGLAPAHTLGQ